MSYQFSLADVHYLASPAGAEALLSADTFTADDTTLLAELTAARRFAGEHAAAVVETVRLRRRAVGKLGAQATGWLWTDEALQQASPWLVAVHRASRLAGVGVGVHDVTCSVGTDVAALNASGVSPIVGSDIDPIRIAMARANLPGSTLVLADAIAPVSRGLLPYADPARRVGGRRITGVHTVPSVAALEAAYADRPPVLRLPPGVDYEHLDRPGEVEIVSLDGAAREAVLWPAALADPSVRRRATVLTTGASQWQIGDDADDGGAETTAASVAEWIIDPDPAVVRAHLVRHYAARYNLHLLDEHLAYLTGPRRPPGIRAFQVLDHGEYAEKAVAQWLRRDGIGTLEIKQRGTSVVPDELRRRLRPAMSKNTRAAATVVIARIGGGVSAFWCRAVTAAG